MNRANIILGTDLKIVVSVVASVCISHAITSTDSSSKIFNQVAPSVFTVSSYELQNDPFSPGSTRKKINGTGTGFVYHNKDYVITNAHVISNSEMIKVDDMDAQIVGVDERHDIALLKISPRANMQTKTLHKCIEPVRVGDSVLALGNPLGFDKSLTRGIISGIDRSLDSDTRFPLLRLIQTDASINPGNSGGPLLNAESGCVLGVNTALVSSTGSNSGLGFAISMDVVDHIVDNIINNNESEENVNLGVSLLPDIYSEGLGVEGVIIAGVFPGGIGEKIGLHGTYRDTQGRPNIGDILLEINGQKVKKISDIFVEMENVKKGDYLRLKVSKLEGVIEVSTET